MKVRQSVLGAVASIMVFALSATPALPQTKTLIGAVLYARDSQFWQQVELGMRDAAKTYDVDLQVALSRRQLPTEAAVIDDLVTRGVKALVISPLDKDASATAVKNAKAKGVETIEFNTFFADRNIASHSIGVDNKELAASVGREIAKAISTDFQGDAKIGLIPLPAINPGSAVRKNGLLSALTGVKYQIVGEIEAATPEKGANAVEDILRRDPSTQIIWASNSGSLAGAANTVDHSGDKVQLYGIDMSEELAREMLNSTGHVMAVSDQQPYKLGFLSIETAVKSLKGEKVSRDIEVPVKLYSRSNPADLNDYLKVIQSLRAQ